MKILSYALFLCVLSTTVNADDYCYNTGVTYNQWGGEVSCSGFNGDFNESLTDWRQPQTFQFSFALSEYSEYNGNYVSCAGWAPYYGTITVQEEICEPLTFLEALFQTSQQQVPSQGYNKITFTSTSTVANQTTLVNYKWSVGGTVMQNGSYDKYTVINGSVGRTKTITLEVTDSNGGVDSVTQTVYLNPASGSGPIL